MSTHLFRALCLSLTLTLLGACMVNPEQASLPVSESTLALDIETGNVTVALADQAMAWDGKALWQIEQSEGSPRLSRQEPGKETLQTISVKTENLAVHESMAFGQNSVWLLERDNHVQQVKLTGDLGVRYSFPNQPTFGSLEALTWSGDELWLLNKSYLDSNGERFPAQFWQINPETGEVLKKLSIEHREFNSFTHLNLTSDSAYFYAVRTSIFQKDENQLYRISKTTGKVESKPLNKVTTGMPTIFQQGQNLFGVELLEVENCEPLCQGRLVKLPSF